MRARLTVEAGECSPSVVDLTPGATVTVGRSKENLLVIRDDLVSRLHAKIYYEDGRWLVRDFGLNGTKISGSRLSGAMELRDGTELHIGQVRIRFTTGVVAGQPAFPISSPTPSPSDKKSSEIKPSNTPAEIRATKTTRNLPRDSNPPKVVAVEVASSELPTSAPGPEHLHADELTALCNYMTAAVLLSDPHDLIRHTLRTLLAQTNASVVGYLNLDPNDPAPRLIVPEQAPLDFQLSRRLTERVREHGKLFWLYGDERVGGWNPSSSLTSYTDAICVPVNGPRSDPIAALHVYRSGQGFEDRDVKFIEAAASFLTPALEALRHRRKLEAENDRLRGAHPSAEELIGDSSALMAVRQQIGRSAPMPFTVLITGESGSGKELVALALHRNSPRNNGPLVVVNCAAMTPTMLEAELFGYRKGAFAGADHDHPGLFEQADEGTLFLDEVADLSLECQAKLLRVIEGKPFRNVGGVRDVSVDVRVVAATHRDLETEVKAGRFRQDLLFRLKVISIKVPPLRDHAEDIIELARFFLERLSVQCRRPLRLSAAAERKLFAYPWPGNVRQLRAVLEGAAVMTETEIIDADALPLTSISEMVAPPPSVVVASDTPASLAKEDLETWAILKALKHTAGNVSQAARVLGISRDTLHTKLKKKNIDRESAATHVAHPGDTLT